MYDILIPFVLEFWATLCEMSPYLLFGFFAAGVLSVFISPELIERHLGGQGIWPVVKATIFGIPLPLCSCGVIPVAASLRRHKASRGATTAFLISTPQTGVDSILVTFSLLGPVFAVFRPLAALVNGILGGTAVSAIDRQVNGDPQTPPQQCDAVCCTGDPNAGRWVRALHYGFVTLVRDIGKPLLVGLLIAAAISAAVPKDFFSAYLGRGIGAMLLMMLLGIPVYVCATASVPVAWALIGAGISPGAALVFLMTGPATNAAAIATIWKIMGKRTTATYLASVALTALACGIILDRIFTVTGTSAQPAMPWMLPQYFKVGAAIALIGLLAAAFFRPGKVSPETESAQSTDVEKVVLAIDGMTCSHCAESVRRALNECPGVNSVQVDLKRGEAVIAGHQTDINTLTGAVEELGYKASRVEDLDKTWTP